MELLLIIISVIVIAAIIIGAIFVFTKEPQSNDEKGNIGENRVNRVLSKLDGVLYKNYYILDKRGRSHQIDHIFVCSRGVFVIETKNWEGILFGNDTSKKWTICYDNSYKKYQPFNPVKQNLGHIYQISRILPEGTQIFNIVVIASDTYDISHIDSENVIELRHLKDEIMSHDEVLNLGDITGITNELDNHRNYEITIKQHRANIRKTGKEIDKNICPRCHGKLVLRKNGNDEFYGCENYPYCTYTKGK